MREAKKTAVIQFVGLAAAMETYNDIVLVAAPGTVKTTTLLQTVDALLSHEGSVAVFVPLGEWSSQAESLFQSITRRSAFRGTQEVHWDLLGHFGRLALVLDGWNELDTASRRRASGEIKRLQREFPDLSILISTRRQALDVPVSGPVVEIAGLAEAQQLMIARALRGPKGELLLDHAWRTPGIRELVTIPLYLRALIAHSADDTLPTTK